MLPGISIGDITALLQIAQRIGSAFQRFQEDIKSAFQRFQEDIKSFWQELDDLTKLLVLLKQHSSSGSTSDIDSLEKLVADCRITLEAVLGVLKRYEITISEGTVHSRYKPNIFLHEMETHQTALMSHRKKLQLWLLSMQRRLSVWDEESAFTVMPIQERGRYSYSLTDIRGDPSTPQIAKHRTVYVCPFAWPTTDSMNGKGDWVSRVEHYFVPYGWTSYANNNFDMQSFDGTAFSPNDRHEHIRHHIENRHHIKHKHRPPPDHGSKRLSIEKCQLCHPASYRSALENLSYRIKTVFQLNTLKTLKLLSPILFAPTASALAQDYTSAQDGVSWTQALSSIQTDLLSLWTHPITNSPISKQSANPTALLLATFLSTSTVALAAQANKNDVYQAHIIGFCALAATVAGALREVELSDFVFGYLLWGCVAGLGGSWIVHRVLALGGKGRKGREMDVGSIEWEKGGVSVEVH